MFKIYYIWYLTRFNYTVLFPHWKIVGPDRALTNPTGNSTGHNIWTQTHHWRFSWGMGIPMEIAIWLGEGSIDPSYDL